MSLGAINLFEINYLGFVSHWVKHLTPLQEEDRHTYMSDSVTPKPAKLDLFQATALLNSKVRLASNVLKIQPKGINRYTTSPS